jgi:hypothetical protein
VGKRSREPSGKSEENKQDTAEPNDVESDQQRQRNCVEGTPRRWYGEDAEQLSMLTICSHWPFCKVRRKNREI